MCSEVIVLWNGLYHLPLCFSGWVLLLCLAIWLVFIAMRKLYWHKKKLKKEMSVPTSKTRAGQANTKTWPLNSCHCQVLDSEHLRWLTFDAIFWSTTISSLTSPMGAKESIMLVPVYWLVGVKELRQAHAHDHLNYEEKFTTTVTCNPYLPLKHHSNAY